LQRLIFQCKVLSQKGNKDELEIECLLDV
jgi:hypothetical protein